MKTRLTAWMILPLAIAVFAASCSGGSEATGGLGVGDLAPTFTLPPAQGEQVGLADFVGKKPVLLYFSMGPG